MRGKRFSEEQIIGVLKEVVPVEGEVRGSGRE